MDFKLHNGTEICFTTEMCQADTCLDLPGEIPEEGVLFELGHLLLESYGIFEQ